MTLPTDPDAIIPVQRRAIIFAEGTIAGPESPSVAAEWQRDLEALAGTRPFCAVCRKPVERVTAQRDMLAGETISVVECHGAREESRVRDVEIQGAERIWMGEAFAGARLLGVGEGAR
jgi:hypothetical protein